MTISDFRITRFQFTRDRFIDDSQVRADDANVAARELISDKGPNGGHVGLGLMQVLFSTSPDQAETEDTADFAPRSIYNWRQALTLLQPCPGTIRAR
jgi:hypothetical protein